MRKINTRHFRIASRTTSRDIDRRIALNLIREHQARSRADLARKLNMTGEFGQLPLNPDGPRRGCVASGYWAAHISNLATLSRYSCWNLSELSPNSLRDAKRSSFTVLGLIPRCPGLATAWS
jgi:hypothetical protein